MSIKEGIDVLQKAHQEGAAKYNYFLLAAAGAAIAFAVQKTEDATLRPEMFFVGLAIVFWALSFFCGCKFARAIQSALAANISVLEFKQGTHARQPDHPDKLLVAIRIGNEMLYKASRRATRYGNWQFWFLISGALCFIAWRVAEMIRIS